MSLKPAPLELWGGVECTIVRLGDDYRDQSEETGHKERKDDIDLIAGLGVTIVRYPILWEAVAPDSPDELDFTWQDERLEMLRERGIEVIGGLLHHGSGPKYTELLDPDFPAKLADYAAKVAERYPWIKLWTPVNEPLTTARFSALYGHWYPHTRDYSLFLRALVNECKGTLTAMRAIRERIPDAKLVQTEDLGKCFSTAPLRYQAAFENERRWLSLDLLTGRICPKHGMHRLLIGAGIGWDELEAFENGDAKPDILGINHYLTSERFLDHRDHLYPGHEVGGNGRDTYVDAEAVRVKRLEDDTGFAPRLREAWERYQIPIAITEVHHGCHRDEQLRWFAEVWKSAGALREEGVDLRAVTLWSAFGNVDWRFLLTERRGWYDTGIFDVRGPAPRPTVIAKAAKAYARGEDFDHPALDSPGWWRRPPRLYPWNGRCKRAQWAGRKLLITGATGTLGNAFARICDGRALPFCLTDRAELDICDEQSIASALERHRPWAVINTAGFVRVGDAERERDACFAWNADGPERLAKACAGAGIPLVTFSSDLVFDGSLGRPYFEDDPVSADGAYGKSKAKAEDRVLDAHPDALVVRTSAFFGPWDRYNFGWQVLSALSGGERFAAPSNVEVSPTCVPDLCHAVLDLLIDGEQGLWHLVNDGRVSWHEFACRIAEAAGFDRSAIGVEDSPRAASTALGTLRGQQLRGLDEAIADFVRDSLPLIEPATQLAAE
ncbi:family 1 glycosylhydrolase [Allosphingosinicella sp.]|jgi:dTDP-4-dehydrorhamnose reductase|uniref:family 1 glycosylhydrolase n=1 Tax=Allosphingosinicella sp. TaxID=2823234 RepID=UPI002EF4C937